ncbi:JNK-interacting protein 1 [Coccinella septempunctata]|uniref:JNK-interacting protein 1 n=1 Tax=Coccinella septempunctata TaxID=41139 RepID=UPI001D06F414|nr:JNK-interacting protein 1 [Coccinella septempunctata]
MADKEFEEFRKNFERSTWPASSSNAFYSLVHDISGEEDQLTSSKSDSENGCDIDGDAGFSSMQDRPEQEMVPSPVWPPVGRRRRKLPEIPKNRKPAALTMYNAQHQQLSRELSQAEESIESCGSGRNSILVLKCGHIWQSDSPDSDRVLTDVDSGHSTAHSPSGTDGPKSMSPLPSMSPTFLRGMMFSDTEMLESTHRGLHKFVPRHDDEIEIEIGDPLYVQKEADDLWSEGVNLRTGRMGVFPSAYAVDCDYSDWDSSCEHGRRERYVLGYLGSVETLAHKGTSVVCQAVRRVLGNTGNEPETHPCILEISDQGLRMVDRKNQILNDTCMDYFYSLKNVSFCAFHPRDHRYLGFITKHPTLQRFACHVFRGTESTRPVAEAVGRAFQRFYQKFMETAYPVEDIYIE